MSIEFVTFKAGHLPVKGRGRNGDFKAVAVEIVGGSPDSGVYVSNVNSKDFVANGWLALPPDPETLREVAAKLESLAKEIEANT